MQAHLVVTHVDLFQVGAVRTGRQGINLVHGHGQDFELWKNLLKQTSQSTTYQAQYEPAQGKDLFAP